MRAFAARKLGSALGSALRKRSFRRAQAAAFLLGTVGGAWDAWNAKPLAPSMAAGRYIAASVRRLP